MDTSDFLKLYNKFSQTNFSDVDEVIYEQFSAEELHNFINFYIKESYFTEKNLYYFINCEATEYSNSILISTVTYQKITDIHPLQWQIDFNNEYGEYRDRVTKINLKREYKVLNWKVLSEAEYLMFKGVIG